MKAYSQQARWVGGGRSKTGQSFGWGLVCLSLSLTEAQGQDALLSATSFDQQINAAASGQTSAPVTGFQVGPAQVGLGANVNGTYDDNINGAQTSPESDFYTQAGINLDVDWPVTAHSELHLGSGIGYVHYLQYTANNGLEVSPDSALTYAVSLSDVVLTFYDQLSYTREVTSEASLANLAILPRLDNVAGLRAEWNPDKWTVQAGYSHDDFITDASEDYLNHSAEYFFGRVGRVVAEQTQFGVEASASLTHYQIPLQADNDSISIGGYAEWQVRPCLHLTLRGGPTFYKFYYPASQGGGTSSLNSYYVTLEVQHQLTDYLSQTVDIERDVQAAAIQGSDYIQQLTASYRLAYNLTQNIGLAATFTLEDGNQPYTDYLYFGSIAIPIDTVTENYTRYGVGLEATWQITHHFSAQAGYNHWQRNSNLAERSYIENALSLGFNYTF